MDTRLSEEEFDSLIEKTLNDDTDDYTAEDKYRCQTISGMMIRTLLTIANSMDHQKEYMMAQGNEPQLIAHRYDILLEQYDDPNSFIDYTGCINELSKMEYTVTNILLIKYKNDAFKAYIVPYSKKDYKDLYGTNNIAIFIVPNTIKRLAGKASANGRDILKQYSNRLLSYGYHITGNQLKGVIHNVTYLDAESLIKSIRIINNALHNRV
jgi:hypothetical protein